MFDNVVFSSQNSRYDNDGKATSYSEITIVMQKKWLNLFHYLGRTGGKYLTYKPLISIM